MARGIRKRKRLDKNYPQRDYVIGTLSLLTELFKLLRATIEYGLWAGLICSPLYLSFCFRFNIGVEGRLADPEHLAYLLYRFFLGVVGLDGQLP